MASVRQKEQPRSYLVYLRSGASQSLYFSQWCSIYFFSSGIRKRYSASLRTWVERRESSGAVVVGGEGGGFWWKLLNDSMNFLVRKPLFSLKRPLCDPKAVLLMSWILNLMMLLGMEGMLMSKLVFIKLLSLTKPHLTSFKYHNFYSMRKNPSQTGLKGSWAAKHGVSKQNSGGSLGLGLNPNLNIEDEYIENLLKQIHFMGMQVKLLREKQAQSEGNSLWGVINRSSQPLVTNILDSNQKYQAMRKQLDQDINHHEYHNIRLADQQAAVLSKLGFLQKKIDTLATARKDQAIAVANRQEKIRQKIGEEQTRLRTLQAQRDEETKRGSELSGQLEALMLDVEREKFSTASEAGRIRNDQDIQEVIEGERTKAVQTLRDKMTLLRQSLESSAQFQRAKEDQEAIRETMGQVLKTIAGSQFQLMQVDASIHLAIEQREREVIQRKRLMEEFESLRVVLKELQTLNASRLAQEVANRKRDSLDIQKGETQTRKLEKNLEEVRKKLTRSQDSERVLRQQMEHLQREVSKAKERRGELSQTLGKLSAVNDRQDTELTNYRNEYRRVQDQYQKAQQGEVASAVDLNEIQTEIVYLRQRKEYLSEALNLKEALNQTRLDQLQKVVQKNKDVNETVGLLMDKWQEIRNFSKM